MAKLLGNNYRLWIEDDAGTPAFHEILGNTALSISRQASLIDTSTKSDVPYGTQAPGLRSLTIDFEIIPNLPDANGYGQLESVALDASGDPRTFQIRKGGATGADPADVVFEASMYVGNFSTSMGKDSAVTVSGQLTLAAAPVTDALA